MSKQPEQIRPGSRVECSDRPLGEVERVDRAGAGSGSLLVRRPGGDRPESVSLDLVREVRADGTVLLRCTADELAARGGREAVDTETIQLAEEELVPRKEVREIGTARIRKEVEEAPRRLEAEAWREDVIVEHVPVGRVVREREDPREEGDVLVIPIYEEQLVLVKRLVLREELHVRRERSTERQVFEDTVRRERAVIEDREAPGRVREQYPSDEGEGESDGGLLEKLGRKMLE